MAHVEKSVSMQLHFEQFVGKQRRLELKSIGNFIAKAVMIESANQFSLEELYRTQYSLKYFSKPYRPSDPLEKPLTPRRCVKLLHYSFKHILRANSGVFSVYEWNLWISLSLRELTFLQKTRNGRKQ